MDTRTILESLYKDKQAEEDKYLTPQEADDFESEGQDMSIYDQMRLRSLMRQQQAGGGQGGGIDGNMMAGALRMFGGGMGGGAGGAGASGTTGNAALDAMFGQTGGELGAAGAASNWIPALGGAYAGFRQGMENSKNDPNMNNHKDGFGTAHDDWRAEVGGGVLGGVLGYFGGPVGSAVAGPVVKAAHPIMEKGSRAMVKFGDSWGGAGGAMMMDPLATMTSGKYGWGDIAKGAFLGPMAHWLKI